ncbi:MAG: SusC/RagA family TonB-linked outer membrane protein, partial [Bacteroidetes bacterium]|nr:SusC/RagA family TonB-linked outer membrane protein [Bacteroidota bacterium]
MRKITILLAFLFMLGASYAQAQTRTISGKVTSAEDGGGLPGVTVLVKGTQTGTITDLDGNYKLTIPSDATTLVFQFVGMKTVEVAIGSQDQINTTLEQDVHLMDEVVVTALGISREKKSLGYSVQEVGGDDITKGASTNVVNSLSGRVAGVSVSSSSGNMAGSSRVLIRGAASILGNNEPLYVVDGIPLDNSNYNSTTEARGGGGVDFGNMAQDINPDDIETITVLKGASASALYGSRAANGVIMITTKTGSRSQIGGKRIGVTFNTGITAEQVSVLPNYQNTYGGGYYTTFDTSNVGGVDVLTPYYGADESWGPKMEGQQVYAWWNAYDYEQGITDTPQTSAWSPHPNNVKDFFNTGLAYRNSVAVSAGDDVSNFRAGWTNLTRSGVFPNSKLTRNTFNFNGMSKFGKRLTVTVGGTYVVNNAFALPDNGYGDNSIMQKFAQWGQRSWDMEKMKNYKNPDGTQRTWNRTSVTDPTPAYSDNPYWIQYENYSTNDRNRFFGNVNVKYDFTDYLNVTGAIYADRYSDRRTTQTAVYSAAESFYNLELRQFMEYNGEVRLNYDKMVTETLRLTAFVGFNMMDQKYYRSIQTTTGGLSIPDFYS